MPEISTKDLAENSKTLNTKSYEELQAIIRANNKEIRELAQNPAVSRAGSPEQERYKALEKHKEVALDVIGDKLPTIERAAKSPQALAIEADTKRIGAMGFNELKQKVDLDNSMVKQLAHHPEIHIPDSRAQQEYKAYQARRDAIVQEMQDRSPKYTTREAPAYAQERSAGYAR